MMSDPLTIDALAAAIARRLRPVVPDMPPAELDGLVRRMAAVQLKYELHAAESAWRQVTPALGIPLQSQRR